MIDEEIKKLFSGKKITLMGLGLLGRGIGDAEFLAEAGADLIVTDLKTEADLKPALERLAAFPNIAYHLGGHRMEDFENRDMIIRAPNAPLDSPFLAKARELGIPVEMDASLFAKLSRANIVGVTGTRGKSTVTHLIYEMAKAAGMNPRLGGNERNTATLPLIKEVKPGDLVILELDSWQLQGFEESAVSPHIAVWTNFMRDHMNYYHGDMERYFRDKAAIARFQKPGDVFITNEEIENRFLAEFGPDAIKGEHVINPILPPDWTVALPGAHNRANAAFAAVAAEALNIDEEIIKKTLKEFKGLPHRLEFLGEKRGITYYNDTNATSPDAAIAALEALGGENRPIALIAGGSDKDLDFEALAGAISANAASVTLITGTATEKLLPLLEKKGVAAAVVKTMNEAFTAARMAAEKHGRGIVLLSPGAASFGVFKNEYDRGEQFKAEFAKLAE